MKIHLSLPYTDQEELEAVKRVLDSGWLAHGPVTDEFEKEFAKYIGVKYATAVNSCASALFLTIEALNLKGEIILPSFTHTASANAIVKAGCKPIFVDINPKTCNIDVNKIKEKINENTVAIMPVHFAGLPCNMDELNELSVKYGLPIIEDSAQTIGGTFRNKKTGSFGIGCFSFYPVKNMTTGEGGMVTSNDYNFIEKVKTLKAHGMSSTAFEREKIEKPWFRSAITHGHNMRLCDINSAIGLAQLKKLDYMNEARRKNAHHYSELLQDLNLELPSEPENHKHVYQMYTVKLIGGNRDGFIKKLKENGIPASVHFDPPVHLQQPYSNINYELPITEKVSQNIVTLPMYPSLKKEEIEFIADKIKEIQNK